MITKYAFITLVFLACTISRAQNCNYITDYYQLVYEAQQDYMLKDYESAFKKLKEAQSKCELLNQPGIYEFIMMAVLSEHFGQPEIAFNYLDEILKKGFPFERFQDISSLDKLRTYPEWQTLSSISSEYQLNYTKKIDQELLEEIEHMADERNKICAGWYSPSIVAVVDSINEAKIDKILRTKGFPTAELLGYDDQRLIDFYNVMFRVKDVEYFEEILFGYVKRGKGYPDAIGLLIDAKIGQKRKNGECMLYYGMDMDMDSTRILDFKNIDKRRVAVGLRTWEMRRKLIERINKPIPVENPKN